MAEYQPPTRVIGVDFSADRERAGEKIWIAEAVVEGDADPADGDASRLHVVDCRRVTDRLGVGPRRAASIPALTRLLAGLGGDAAVGLDFPFGLPAAVVAADSWPAFLRRLPDWADDPPDMARESEVRANLGCAGGACGGVTDAVQLLRATDEPLGALSPYDPRLRAQTFYGIRDVLRPLVLADVARGLPMQPLSPGTTHLLEVYPAGTLSRLDARDARYKSDDEPARRRRIENLDALADGGVGLAEEVRERAVEDPEGDALDAVVAAFAAYGHTRDPSDLQVEDGVRVIEGHIYV